MPVKGEALQSPLRARGFVARPFSRVIAVVDGPNPSFDYYLAPRFGPQGPDLVMAELRARPSRVAAELFEDALLLFCRYVTPDWLQAIESCRGIAGVALFIDDDLCALAADGEVPAKHRLRYWWHGQAQWSRLARKLDLLLVSTPELARRHAPALPRELPALASPVDLVRKDRGGEGFTVAYHASVIHGGEHRWLMPLARELLAAAPGLRFEVTARSRVAAQWSSCRGVTVRPPWPWPEYRAANAGRGIDLMLAPLLPTPANAARSWTKRIDAARAGAALLVSDASVYRPSPEEQDLGMRVELNVEAWCEAILALAGDRLRLRQLARLNHAAVSAWGDTAAPLFEPNGDGRWRLAPRVPQGATGATQVL